tara:strand:- start:172 stop:327 length:156 start_codon:yes stop_codon:yes gene_type:complete
LAKEEEKIAAAVAKEYKKLETVLEKVKVKKRPLHCISMDYHQQQESENTKR